MSMTVLFFLFMQSIPPLAPVALECIAGIVSGYRAVPASLTDAGCVSFAIKYRGVNMNTGALAHTNVDSLSAFFPGTQVLVGDLES